MGLVLVLALLFGSRVLAGSVPSGDPFQAIWEAIFGQAEQINTLNQEVSKLKNTVNELANKLEQVPWDMTGTYTVYWGGNRHQMIVDSMNLITGEFSGHGIFLDAPGYSWTMTGALDGYSFNFRIVYTETLPGYYVDTTGTVAPDGSLSGSGVSSIGENFTFHSTSGTATKNN